RFTRGWPRWSVALLAVALAVYWLPSPINPKPHNLKGPPPALVGLLAVNTQLQRGRRLFAGKLHGPESFTADDNGNVYTGTVDGKLWRIGPDDSLTLVTHMGQNLPECGSSTDYELVCGRPHGVRLDRHGQLIVADSYFGLYRVDPRTGEKTRLVANTEGARGVPFAFLNGLEISSQAGIIYFTDSSSRWGRRHVRLEVRQGNCVRSFNELENKCLVLGPCLLADFTRISKFSVFPCGSDLFSVAHLLTPFLATVFGMWELATIFVSGVMPLSWFNLLLPYYGLVLELGPNGEIVRTLHDPEGRLTWAVSDVFQHRGRTYLGSTDLPFLPVLEGW
ncbi:adipocyte plasma membrane-associated protein-like, partial [Nothobranchius furzeri]